MPYGNEKEWPLIMAKAGHEGCGIYRVATLEELIDYSDEANKT